jgi:hypothetical protein
LKHNHFAPIVSNFVGLEMIKNPDKDVFDLDVSKKNIGIWKIYQDLPEIKKIERELAVFCYTT